ncbi:MAG: hypothetical protein QXG67_03400 [Candidatus Nitrosotenuis sp.]
MSPNQHRLSIFAVLVAVSLGLYVQTSTVVAQTMEDELLPEVETAVDFVMSGPTFAFDGIIDSLEVDSVMIMESFPPQYRVIIVFDSAHGGYGNRDGQVLTQAITPHRVDVLISEGIVRSAIIDGKWDEIRQQFVLGQDDGTQTTVPQLNMPIKIAINKNASIESEDLHLMLLSVSDSRCPADVVCIQEGDAKATIYVLQNDLVLGEFTLVKAASEGLPAIQNVGKYRMHLVQVEPYPYSNTQITQSDYIVTLMVTKYVSPKQQIDRGIEPSQVVCEDGLVLIQKISDGMVACVTSGTAQKLADRNWAAI